MLIVRTTSEFKFWEVGKVKFKFWKAGSNHSLSNKINKYQILKKNNNLTNVLKIYIFLIVLIFPK